MEATKLSCFLTKFKANADKIVTTMESLEAQVRDCYEEPSDHLNSQEFVEMMVYDACFIVQLIRGDFDPNIFKERGIRDEIVNDLLLFENQLPFFVISKLYHIIMQRDVHQLARDALSLFHSVDVPVPNKDFKHLLDLVYSCHRPSARGITQPRDFRGSIEFIGSATELDNAGIDFFGVTLEKIKDPKQGIETMFDIMFTQDRVLRIPTLTVDDWTELNFRNYIVYEQFIPSGEPTYYSDYVLFMDYLINTSKDVELLRKKRIINNCLGDDGAVAQMFNRLQDFVVIEDNFYYAEIFVKVNRHYQKKRNTWMATLKKKYFNSPWSFISFLAATVLLLLTIAQTIFSVLSYINKRN